MRPCLFLLLACLAGAAHAADPPVGVSVGEWNFDCKDGKLVRVQVVLRIPGEVLLPVPADVCTPAGLARSGSGIQPLAVIRPLGQPPAPAAAATAASQTTGRQKRP